MVLGLENKKEGVISHTMRFLKELWSKRGKGEKTGKRVVRTERKEKENEHNYGQRK